MGNNQRKTTSIKSKKSKDDSKITKRHCEIDINQTSRKFKGKKTKNVTESAREILTK